jgi:hypothetical protein
MSTNKINNALFSPDCLPKKALRSLNSADPSKSFSKTKRNSQVQREKKFNNFDKRFQDRKKKSLRESLASTQYRTESQPK